MWILLVLHYIDLPNSHVVDT